MRIRANAVGAAAFTLVELLVVLGIISVLIGLLFPALVGFRKQAQAAVCAANLRSIGQSMRLYTERYGYYPAWSVWDGQARFAIWTVRLREFTNGDQGVFHCPSVDERFEWARVAPEPGAPGRATELHARYGYGLGEVLQDADWHPFSYGYNAGGVPSGRQMGLGFMLVANPLLGEVVAREVRASQVIKPAEMIAITDTGDGVFDFVSVGAPDDLRGAPGKIHNGAANVLFCDGHVQRYPQKDLLVTYNRYVESEAFIRRMWNRDHRVHGGVDYDLRDGG